MASPRSLLLAAVSCSLLLECALGLSDDIGDTSSFQGRSCDFGTFSSLRSTWSSKDEPCHQKLPFEMWTTMKAEESPPNVDAQHVKANCLHTGDVDMLELSFSQTRSTYISQAPGNVASQTKNAATYVGGNVATLEALCDDDNIIKVTRVEATLESQPTAERRRLQSTVSEAGRAHEVAELIAGLEDLGCSSTTGEGQTLCIMSDSFNLGGNAATLEALGDLPPVDVVKELPNDPPRTFLDEGSAMIELCYDIAPGASYKFNSAFLGAETFGADIVTLATVESCDVIVDDVGVFSQPSYRDGVIAQAVDTAVNGANSLYFSSAGNYRSGMRFPSAFECDTEFGLCDLGATHVFNPGSTDMSRYLMEVKTAQDNVRFLIALNWDEDIGDANDLGLAFFFVNDMGDFQLLFLEDRINDGSPTEIAIITSTIGVDLSGIFMAIIHLGQSDPPFMSTDFHLFSSNGFASGSNAGSMWGHSCASKAFSVAAMDWRDASGPGGEFADPETSPVEVFSSRGPCVVGRETRDKPVTCAADGLTTSTPGFSNFFGTSAAAPVAAAIATLVRGACAPRVVGYDDILDMLTNYDYTIDVTSDGGGAPETWAPEAGHGMISAGQMLAWVKANCPDSCPGAGCTTDTDCDMMAGEICCTEKNICEVPDDADPGACGDPHMTGFRGQKFDFTGEDGGWYAVLSSLPDVHLNMRVTSPVPSVPEITYITGISILATDADGVDHTIVITVADPHSLDSGCPEGVSPCLAEGALNVELDGEVALLGPGEVVLGPDVAVSAVNLPGECRSFGFEKYWERKKAEYASAGRRRLLSPEGLQGMEDWILGDPTATNMAECQEYVDRVVAAGDELGLFAHDSEHASFQIMTPIGYIRLSHGRLHQLPMRDPTDRFDLPDHLTWQQNLAIDHHDLSLDATGILGETLVPTLSEQGTPIMQGMEAIRGSQEHYRVAGPLGTTFAQATHQQ